MELKRHFVQGKMNKDLDPRLIPDGEYIDALNVIVSNTEGQEVGSVQNVYGLEFISNYQLPADSFCIGSVADEANSCIYWLVTSPSKNLVLEYNEDTLVTSVVLEDSRPSGSNVLNFDSQFYVTGINIIYNSFNKEKLLVWTDDLNPIRCVNVKRAKGYAPSSFNSDDISLYKKPPFQAPDCTPTTFGDGSENNLKERFLSFAYRYKYLDGEYSALSAFSNPQFYPSQFRLDYVTQENSGMVNQFNAVKIEFNTGDRNVSDVQLVFKESNSDFVYVIDTFNKSKQSWSDGVTKNFVFANNKIYNILPNDEIKRLFDNVPLKAKSQEFIGNRLIYGNYVEGQNMIDVDGNLIKADYSVEYQSEDFVDNQANVNFESINEVNDVVVIDLSNKELKKGSLLNIFFNSNSNADFYAGDYFSGGYASNGSFCQVLTTSPHSFTTGDEIYFKAMSGGEVSGFYTITVTSSTEFYFSTSLTTSGACSASNYEPRNFGGSTYSCSVSYYLTNDYVNAQQLSLDPDFINFISVVATANFVNNSNIIPVQDEDNSYTGKFLPFQIISSTNVNVLKIKLPYVNHKVWINSPDLPEIYNTTDFVEYMKFIESSVSINITEGNSLASCKSNRSYEVGLVYLDETGRYSTVISNESNSDGTVFIPVSQSYKKNTLNLEINHKAPRWANRYKVFVKDNKLEYQTVYGTFVFKDGNFLWIKLEGLDNQKVSIGDNLILKRDVDGPRDFLTKVEVLDYKTQLSNFIDSTTFVEPQGNYIKIKNTQAIDLSSANKVYKENDASSSMKNGSATSRMTLFTEYNGTTYTDYAIPIGSKINIFIRNEKGGSSGGRYVYEKDFITLNEYANFYDFYNTEVVSALPFYPEFFRLEDGDDINNTVNHLPVSSPGYLCMKVKSIMNGNGQNRTFMYMKISILSSTGLLIFETDPKDKSSQIFYETQDTYLIDDNGNHLGKYDYDIDQDYIGSTPCSIKLNFFNCFSQGNGAESYIVRDKFNGNYLSTATRGNAVEIDGYNQVRNIASLTYSGAFDETLSYNSLNEFNLSRANYKDLDDRYGSIQKLFTKDTNLIVFQQYKVHNILYNKNVLFDSVGGGQITSVENVLGNEVPFTGEFGIGNHPESFSYYGNSMYFADHNKRVVLRIGGDGIQTISTNGMTSEFVKLFDQYKNNFIFGGFDDKKQQYYITFSDVQKNIEQEELLCNTEVSGIITNSKSYSFIVPVQNQTFTMNIQYSFSSNSSVTIASGESVETINDLSGTGTISYEKSTNLDYIEFLIETEEESVDFSLIPECPEIPEGAVVLIVVNESSDASKSMQASYSWKDLIAGTSGGNTNNEIFDSSGVTRFEVINGFVGVNEIPPNGANVSVKAKDGSFDFGNCNRMGYVVSSSALDVNSAISSATWLSLSTSGLTTSGSFTFSKPSENHILYLIWDCTSVLSVSDDLVSVNENDTISIDVLSNDSYSGPVTVSIVAEPSNGTATVVGNNIEYTNTSGNSDFIVYSVEDENGCRKEGNINISVNQTDLCYRFTSFKYLSNVLEGEDETITFQYTDCNDVVQTLEFIIPGEHTPNPFLYKEYVFNDEIFDPVICCKSGTVTQIGGNVILGTQYNTYAESIFCSI